MLVKTFLVAAVLAASPILSVAQEVHAGSWPDGAEIVWQCDKRAQGTVKFIFVTPEGKQYAGMFSCGQTI